MTPVCPNGSRHCWPFRTCEKCMARAVPKARVITPDAILTDLVVAKALAWSAAIETNHELEARVGLLLAIRALEGHRS